MKLTKSQKKILKSIPNKKIRLEQKLQFKIQNRFLSREPIIFIDGMFETDNPSIIEFLSQHPMCEKERDDKFKISDEKRAEYNRVLADRREQFEKKIVVEKITDNNLKNTGYEDCFFKVTIPIGTPIQDSLNAVDEFFKQKTEIGNEIISNEKAKEIYLNNEYLQKVLSETHDVKFFRDLQNICVKCQNYEYASKFRQKVRDILVTLSTEKLIELVQNGTIDLSDMTRAIGCKKDKSANDVEKKQ